MENEMNLDFDLVPTVEVASEDGSFSVEVIEMYELPFEKVIVALNAPHGPSQMMAMLEIFKLAVVDQSRIPDLEIMSFNDMADLLGQWAMLSTPPEIPDSRPKKIKRGVISKALPTQEADELIEKVLDADTSFEELLEIAQFLASEDEPPHKPRGRHALPFESEIDAPLNDPGDGFEAF